MRFHYFALRPLVLFAAFAAAAPNGARAETARETICRLVDRAAVDHGIPTGTFTRLIWRESSFRAGVTSHAGAEGIAQFMPGTAAERGVDDPFDPEQAIPAAASLISDLASRFGSLGLAAAAYNAGPNRVAGYLSGDRTLPSETLAYVSFVTGWSVDQWKSGLAEASGVMQVAGADAGCLATVAAIKAAEPSAASSELDQAVLPWGVQLTGGYSKDRQRDAYARLRKRYEKVIGTFEPTLLPFRVGGAKPRNYYQVRIAFADRKGAAKLCRSLRAAGGDCLVMRN